MNYHLLIPCNRVGSCNTLNDTYCKKVVAATYGVKEDNWLEVNWKDGATLPCSFMNLSMQFPIYYSMFSNKNINGESFGWPLINKTITKSDAGDKIDKTIISYSLNIKYTFPIYYNI